MSGRLDGKVAVVTGAGSGLGRAAAVRFVTEGARVHAVDRDGDALRGVGSSLDGAVAAHVADVADSASMEELAADVLTTDGRVDVVFANAGIEGVGTAADLTEDDWDRVLGVDLKGVWLSSKWFLPAMVEQGSGAVVNTASIGGLVGVPGIFPYAAAKGGVVALTRQMGLDYAPYGIRVNAVCPGTVVTPLVERNWVQKGLDVEERRTAGARDYPLGRLGEPDDIANAVLFLASDEASWITGQAIVVDGGYTMK
jgi:NAD(P)-dependent dehydrogenase (short-subunit alcohol dehydrogenase family)